MFEDLGPWLVSFFFGWVAQDERRAWIFVALCVIAIFLWAGASLMDLGTEFGVAALGGLFIAGNSGFFLGLAVFTLVFLALFVVLGSVASRWGVALAFAVALVVGWAALVSFGPDFSTFFGLSAFMAAFLILGGLLARMESGPSRPVEARQGA